MISLNDTAMFVQDKSDIVNIITNFHDFHVLKLNIDIVPWVIAKRNS
jgi:hypothetical protein